MEKAPAVVKESTYSACMAIVFILNVTLGSGPITLPYGFAQSGLILSLVFLVLIAFIAFVNVTYLVETMSIGDEMKKMSLFTSNGSTPSGDSDSTVALLTPTGPEIEEVIEPPRFDRIEIGSLSKMFMSDVGLKLTYLFLVLYLVGCLSVYSITASNAVAVLIGKVYVGNSHFQMYHLVLIIFALIAIPFCFGNFQNTKYLQTFIMVMRFVVIVLMLFAAFERVFKKQGANIKDVPMWQWKGLPWLFGNAVFTFMMHHSAPGLLQPIEPQKKITPTVAIGYLIVLVCYFLLATSSLVAFSNPGLPEKCGLDNGPACKIQDMYNKNFNSYHNPVIGKFLGAYPALMLALYPLVCITLRNNLKTLLFSSKMPASGALVKDKYHYFCTFLAAIVPICIAIPMRDHVQIVSTIAGAYPGVYIIMIMPGLLNWYSRKHYKKETGRENSRFKSAFGQGWVIIAMFVVSGCIMIMNTVTLIRKWTGKGK